MKMTQGRGGRETQASKDFQLDSGVLTCHSHQDQEEDVTGGGTADLSYILM